MADHNEPLPSDQRESSSRQEDKQVSASSHPSDPSVQREVRRDSSLSNGNEGSVVSASTAVGDETSLQDASLMEVQVSPAERQTSQVRSRTSGGGGRDTPGDDRPKGTGKTQKGANAKGGDNAVSSKKTGGSNGIMSSYRERFRNISSKINPPENKSKK